jgi:hypothetical protein
MRAYQEFKSSAALYIAAVVGSFLIVGLLVWAMYRYTRPPEIAQNRAAERRKFLGEIRAAEIETLNNYGWVDQGKGIVRLPIGRALELTLQEAQNPMAARSNLVARAEKAGAVPPKAPEQPSKYE